MFWGFFQTFDIVFINISIFPLHFFFSITSIPLKILFMQTPLNQIKFLLFLPSVSVSKTWLDERTDQIIWLCWFINVLPSSFKSSISMKIIKTVPLLFSRTITWKYLNCKRNENKKTRPWHIQSLKYENNIHTLKRTFCQLIYKSNSKVNPNACTAHRGKAGWIRGTLLESTVSEQAYKSGPEGRPNGQINLTGSRQEAGHRLAAGPKHQ